MTLVSAAILVICTVLSSSSWATGLPHLFRRLADRATPFAKSVPTAIKSPAENSDVWLSAEEAIRKALPRGAFNRAELTEFFAQLKREGRIRIGEAGEVDVDGVPLKKWAEEFNQESFLLEQFIRRWADNTARKSAKDNFPTKAEFKWAPIWPKSGDVGLTQRYSADGTVSQILQLRIHDGFRGGGEATSTGIHELSHAVRIMKSHSVGSMATDHRKVSLRQLSREMWFKRTDGNDFHTGYRKMGADEPEAFKAEGHWVNFRNGRRGRPLAYSDAINFGLSQRRALKAFSQNFDDLSMNFSAEKRTVVVTCGSCGPYEIRMSLPSKDIQEKMGYTPETLVKKLILLRQSDLEVDYNKLQKK